MKNIFIADKIADDGIEYLQQQKEFTVTLQTGLDEDDLCQALAGQHALIIRSGVTVTDKVLAAAPQLEVIGRAGIGVDNVDVNSATERGVAVLNTPNANATTTAELAIAHLFSLSRNLPQADRSVRAGEWKRSEFIGVELAHKKIGIVGYGTIGRLVAARANALKMQVLAFDPFVTAEAFAKDNVQPVDIDELVSQVDFITLHCPVNDKTRNIISRERIASMRKGTRIINCARGGLIDEAALFDALQSGHLGGAALDVYNEEPPKDLPLLSLNNVVFTPHLGASTREAQSAAGIEIARQVALYLQTGEPVNAINLPSLDAAELIRLQPYMKLVNRLAQLLSAMIEEPIQELELVAYGEVAEFDIRALKTESLIGLLSSHMSIPINRVNAAHIAAEKGIKVTEISSDESQDYHAVIRLTAIHADRRTSVAGTVFDRFWPRLVRVNDYEIEAALQGHLLFTRHHDQPGVIAAISSMLAEKQINIARMQLGIVPDSNKAVAVLEINTPLDNDSMQQLLEIPAISKALQITL